MIQQLRRAIATGHAALECLGKDQGHCRRIASPLNNKLLDCGAGKAHAVDEARGLLRRGLLARGSEIKGSQRERKKPSTGSPAVSRLAGLLELVGQGKAAIHLFPKQFPTTSMHPIGAVMEVAGLVTKGVTDATPIVWPKGAGHSAGDRRLAEQHDQPDATNKRHKLDEKPWPWLARIAQPANG